jgi:hypothetical protein
MNVSQLNLRRFSIIAAQGLVITIVVSSLVLLFTSSGDTLKQLGENVYWPRLPLLVLPVFVSWSCNAMRFHLMSRCIGHPLSFRRSWAIAVSYEFGAAASPGGIGGTAVRLGFLKKSGISFVHGGSLLAADVFLDILFFAGVTPFALLVLLHRLDGAALGTARHWHPAWLLLLLIPAAFVAFRAHLYRAFLHGEPALKYRVAARIRMARRKALHGLRQGRAATHLIFKNHLGALTLNFLLSAVQIASRYSVLPLAIGMLGVPVDPLPLIMIQGMLFMVSMAVVAPGGGGSVELLAALALPRFMPVHLVGVAILLWRLFTYHFYLLFGGAVFAATFRRLMRD